MFRVLNCTPHEITIYSEDHVRYDEKQRKYFLKSPHHTALAVKRIPPSGTLLNAKIDYVLTEIRDGIPLFEQKVIDCDPVPRGYDAVIVSNLYAQCALMVLDDIPSPLFTVGKPVYLDPDNPRPVGCLGLVRVD